MNWIYSLAVSLGIASLSLSVMEQEQAAADVAAAYAYAALADGADAAPRPKTPTLRVLVFSGEFCQPCKELHAALTRDLPAKGWKIGADASSDLEFVDMSKDRARATKYGVTSVPCTVIIDAAGEQKAKLIGGMSSGFFVTWCAEKGKAVGPEPK